MNFKKQYADLFTQLGCPPKTNWSSGEAEIKKAESRLGIAVPSALRDYYLVAGKEPVFNQCHNRFLSPAKWSVENGKLVFLEENQWVVFWGTTVSKKTLNDPAVYQAVNEEDEPFEWHKQEPKCSRFLSVMLLFHAVSGGFKHCGQDWFDPKLATQLKKSGWKREGNIDGLEAFRHQGKVVCLEKEMGVMAAGKTQIAFEEIKKELNLKLNY